MFNDLSKRSELDNDKRRKHMRKMQLLMTPGPTNIPEDIQKVLAYQTPHHRSQAFAGVFQKMRDNLKTMINCQKGEVITFASSGTGSMEAAIINFNRKAAHVLVVETGYFGTRFTDIAHVYDLQVTTLSFTGGMSADIQAIERVLVEQPDIQTVYVTHHDTSTGVKNDLQAIGECLKKYPEILFVIDSISGMVMHEVDMDEWGIDVLLGASQKGFMVPPGLSFMCINEKAIARSKQAELPRFYFDVPKQLEMLRLNQTFATPAISLIYAMEYATTQILKRGMDVQYQLYEKRRKLLEKHLIDARLRLVVSEEEAKGNVVVPVYIPNGLRPQAIVDYMEKKTNIMIIGGYGQLKDTTVRIGVLGPISDMDIEDTVRALTHAIETLLHTEEQS